MKHQDIIATILIVSAVIGIVLVLSGCMRQEIHVDSKEACTEGSTVVIGSKIYCDEDETKKVKL